MHSSKFQIKTYFLFLIIFKLGFVLDGSLREIFSGIQILSF